jgi:uncharacterized protein (DUF2252 family)
LRTQLCGDAHLSNFGAYASPERRLVFTAMKAFAAQPILTVWYAHLEIEQAIADYKATLSGGN